MGNSRLEKKINILLTGPVPPPAGGIATFCETLKKNFDNTTFHIKHPLLGKIKKEKSHFTQTISRLLIYARFIYYLFKIFPEVVHINTASYSHFYYNSIFLLLSKFANRKTILHIHGGGFAEFYEKSGLLKRNLIKAILRSADAVIVLSDFWKAYLSTIIRSDKLTVINNAVDVDSFNHNYAHGKSKRSKINVSFLGTVCKEKGVYDIIEAIQLVFNEFDNCIFTFAGKVKKEVISLCKKVKIFEYTKFLGEIYGEEKMRFLTSSDIFILPSYIEGLPIAMLEAMASGLPVIATPVGAIPEVVRDNVNGYIIPVGNSKKLAEKIILLAKNRELRAQIGLNNVKKMRQKYDIKSIEKQIIQVYENLIC